jgi:hypothetical protein
MSHIARRLILESEGSQSVDVPYEDAPVPEGTHEEICSIDSGLAAHYDELCQLQDQAMAYETVLEQFPTGTVITEREQALLKSFVNLSLAGTGLSTENFKSFREKNYSMGLEDTADSFWDTLKKVLEKIIEAIRIFFNWLTKSNTTVEQSQASTEKLLEEMVAEAKKDPHKIWIGRISAHELSNFSEEGPKSSTSTLFGAKIIEEFHDACKKAVDVFHAYTNELEQLTETHKDPAILAEEVMKRFESLKREGVQGSRGPSADHFFAHVCGRWYISINRKSLESSLIHDTAGIEHSKMMDVKIEGSAIEELARSYKAKCDQTFSVVTSSKSASKASVAALEKEVRQGAVATDKVFRTQGDHAADSEERKAAMMNRNIARLSLTVTQAYAKMIRLSFDLDKAINSWLRR